MASRYVSTRKFAQSYTILADGIIIDKNKDNEAEALEMFKLIAEAYEVLCDPEKRETYDRYGKEGLRSGGGGRRGGEAFHFDFDHAQSLFEQFFGDDPFL